MSDAKSKRALRQPPRSNGGDSDANPAQPPEAIADLTPETATAAVALETAVAADAIAEPIAAATEPRDKSASFAASLADDPWAIWSESQSALTRGFEAVATEVTGLTRSGLFTASEAAKALLGAKTWAEAVEINADFARRSFDAMIGGTAKLSEIGVKAATEAARPVLNRLGETWNSLRAP